MLGYRFSGQTLVLKSVITILSPTPSTRIHVQIPRKTRVRDGKTAAFNSSF